ncbi:dihydrofolate reductase family protein [Chitinophaga pendula]|uniref:dihydrofolate reductase family protein n=1 Tax=Chitinophaga TaxID=79328 RepID=UPI000BAECCAB|nr:MULTISPECIES: dihydrofolate reductase family protein [Chitinophaga]ASZ13508.1 deaminase [Chitinophaga sp. MD30]UCJ08863.1 dihydrofolate reductase family protein [Chitinophaga pendula]
MRRIRIFEHISLDGVIEHDADYIYGAWTTPYRSPAGAAMLFEAYGPNFDILLGRNTYDIFSKYWPTAGDFPMANAINTATKYIVTHRPDSLEWGPVKGLSGDIAAAIHDIKSTDGPDIIVVGSSTLTSLLLDQGLADEVILITYPVLLGRGKRLISHSIDARELTFVDSKATPTGLLINTYKHLGSLKK